MVMVTFSGFYLVRNTEGHAALICVCTWLNWWYHLCDCSRQIRTRGQNDGQLLCLSYNTV